MVMVEIIAGGMMAEAHKDQQEDTHQHLSRCDSARLLRTEFIRRIRQTSNLSGFTGTSVLRWSGCAAGTARSSPHPKSVNETQ